jgi:hypothetical protein
MHGMENIKLASKSAESMAEFKCFRTTPMKNAFMKKLGTD